MIKHTYYDICYKKNVMIFSPEHMKLLDLLLYLNEIENINVYINSNTFFFTFTRHGIS